MPISSRKLGPGTLTLGTAPLSVESQLTACKVTPSESVESGDRTKVLSGEVLEADESTSYSYVLEGNFLQDDPGAASVVDWSWDNAGTEQPFTFVPHDAVGGRTVTGTLVPVPLSIGGDEVETTMASDFTWRIKGTPTRSTVAA